MVICKCVVVSRGPLYIIIYSDLDRWAIRSVTASVKLDVWAATQFLLAVLYVTFQPLIASVVHG